jgi:hypothetical protein
MSYSVLCKRTLALRLLFQPLPDFWLYLVVDTNGNCRVPTIDRARETAFGVSSVIITDGATGIDMTH